MKPPPFDYHAPQTIDDAVRLLDELSAEDPKILAGGQSLVPMMNLRLARPGHVIDINRIPGLDALEHSDDEITIGARVRHAEVEDSDAVRQALPLLPYVAGQIGYRQIRYRGTVGGSVCHADPVAEWPMIMRLLDAQLDVAGPNGPRTIPADEFFVHVFTTALAPSEMLINLRVRGPRGRWGWGFAEFARKVGDFAVVAAAAIVEASDGAIERARIALAGAGPVPLRADQAEQLLGGVALDDAQALTSAADAAAEGAQPTEDVHGTAGFRKRLVKVHTERALKQACEMASASS
jgi:carbon-monoxide dehydrogenase medium subunit